ncbi:putative NRPS-like enzyme (JCVI) [Aspergillus mulundensis]|uniref:NRPS-like enzyme, putative (JCVI) n=1 Tax=Aspergillus mulundensis TaxID=1810919 RepID=A0A3D8RY27_9EURO|nr:NRPS-like enzyme, putative (JCVI) [Aspergillus mulundensis]RDW78967.1 NRPS-like enzyme, putative (JCVI) [Aspergillus mulundensis]
MGNPQCKREESSGDKPQDRTEALIREFGRLNTLDDLIRVRAADAVQKPILAYPKSQDGVIEYEYFTGEDLDSMIDEVVVRLMDMGFKPPKHDREVIALLTLSDMNMVVTFFALSRLGYTVMMLSPRLAGAACVSLLDKVGCDTIMYGQTGSIRATIGEILRERLVTVRPIVQRPCPSTADTTDSNGNGPCFIPLHRSRNREAQRNRTALILHSSGSTGTPKPLYLSHKAIMTHPLRGPGLTSFNSLPWYHLHGLSTALQAMYMRKVAYMWDVSVPLTTTTAVAALKAAKPESVQGVPYLLQLLVGSEEGLDMLRSCKLVAYGGAPCPDDLGDRLVAEGVRVGGMFGLTEAGLVAESTSRPVDDPHWNYLRFFDNIRSYVWMKPIADDLYECVYLDGHPALTTSNSDEPPGSFHSRDVFTPHPDMPDRWKYVTRLDDRITLVNGEKVLPLPIEGTIKQNVLIDDAVVVGANKEFPGLLVFRSEEAKAIPDKEFLDRIWPSVDDANSRAEQFSQISRDMICVLPHESVRPQTDKGSIIRAQVYARYANIIESLYGLEEESDGALELDADDTETHLLKLCQDELRLSIPDNETEFFAAGVDSLKAIQLRRLVLRDFKFPDRKAFGSNVVFEAGNISRLAAMIHAAQDGQDAVEKDHKLVMQDLIDRYSSFRRHVPVPEHMKNDRGVILTGATGSIGAHTLHQMLNDETVSVVYCLTRRHNPKQAILDALEQKGLGVLPYRTTKIIALTSDLAQEDLGLKDDVVEEMRQCVSLIINTAWPVNFNLPLSSFTPHIQGLNNLINFSLSVHMPTPAVMLFCSSISTALAKSSDTIDESPTGDFSSALEMGYARSKLIGERIVSNARRSGARAYSLRIGQVSGHSKRGLWNDTEAIPLMLRSALTLKVLPDLDTECSWLPSDKLACSIMEIARVCSSKSPEAEDSRNDKDDSLYNLCNSRTFTWSAMLTALRQQGFEFETVAFDDWMEKLRQSERNGEELENPAVKLVDHYAAMHGADAPRPKVFRTDKAERDSETLRNGRLRIIEDGILARYAQDWLRRWR